MIAPILGEGIDPKVLDLLRRRPRLALVVLAVAEMADGRRNCRISIDIADGILRVFREIQEKSISLKDS